MTASGLGSVFRQLRELIKDLSWRNRAERQQHELALLKTRLELAKRYGLSADELDLLCDRREVMRRLPRRKSAAMLPRAREVTVPAEAMVPKAMVPGAGGSGESSGERQSKT